MQMSILKIFSRMQQFHKKTCRQSSSNSKLNNRSNTASYLLRKDLPMPRATPLPLQDQTINKSLHLHKRPSISLQQLLPYLSLTQAQQGILLLLEAMEPSQVIELIFHSSLNLLRLKMTSNWKSFKRTTKLIRRLWTTCLIRD